MTAHHFKIFNEIFFQIENVLLRRPLLQEVTIKASKFEAILNIFEKNGQRRNLLSFMYDS